MSEYDSSEVLQKIGRNVVNFQRLEGMLKTLASMPNYSGSLEEIQTQREKHLSSVRKKSFGLVVRDFFEVVYSEKEPSSTSISAAEEFEISFKIKDGDREQLASQIATLVEARNDLIHHRLTSFDSTSAKSCDELAAYLDEQNEQLAPIYEEVAAFVRGFRETRDEALKHLKSFLAGNNKDDSADA